MKKICYVTTVHNTLNAFVIDTAKYLHEQGGYDITFICDYDEEFERSLPDYINFIPVRMKRGIDLLGFRAVNKMKKIFKENQFDMVQYSTPNASFYASIAAKKAGIPVRLYAQWGILYTGYFGLKRKIFKQLEKTTCKNSTWIEPDSFGNLEFSRQEGLYDQTNSSVIWNGSAKGIDLDRFDISQKEDWRKEIIEKYEYPETDFVIGFVGRVTKDKGLNELLTCLKGLDLEKKNITALMVGQNNKRNSVNPILYKQSLMNKKIIYTERVNDVEKHIAAMDVLVLPSYREGFGSVVIEAGALGVPVVITNIPGPKEAVIDRVTGLITELGDVRGLFDALLYMYSFKEEAALMGEKGRQRVEEKFDANELKIKILEDRNRLLNMG